ncbi:DUF2948 family protein [Rubellimicrobium sp. CFH 75288]|uniref:DUF2948 family protein n=1 Tax=Rubellimicrobium sp. CFH 75288 TaxID=2697034 RepID=UPI001412FA58|nr:DUF2948 family protein [Rubellimicrobium sp. CFH 75288]NAZ37125.1 DUF2948 family protein [Rubellimicrobium sp. CFH 75288]
MNDAGDARFSDADERPLRLRALDPEDLRVVSALIQDSVTTVGDMAFLRRQRRFAALVNRFRWEGPVRSPERVRSMLVAENVTAVRSQGISPRDRDLVLSLLALDWEGQGDGPGRLRITLSGDGEMMVEAEALEVTLTDVTRPYLAPSGRVPRHPD